MASLVLVVLVFIVLTDGPTDHSHTDVDDRYTHVTPVGVSNNNIHIFIPLWNVTSEAMAGLIV